MGRGGLHLTMARSSQRTTRRGYENYRDCQAMADSVVINGVFKNAKLTKENE